MAHDVRKAPASFQTFGPAGPNHSPGLVVDPGSVAGGLTVLCSDAAWHVGNDITPVAAPTALVKLTPTPGVANTVMRSDGAPALDQSISPTWTGNHTFNGGQVRILTSIASSSPTTGSLTVAGGIGVSGGIVTAGEIVAPNGLFLSSNLSINNIHNNSPYLHFTDMTGSAIADLSNNIQTYYGNSYNWNNGAGSTNYMILNSSGLQVQQNLFVLQGATISGNVSVGGSTATTGNATISGQLNVGSNVVAGQNIFLDNILYNGNGTVALALVSTSVGNYNIVYDGSNQQDIFLGGVNDPTNYYRNTGHVIQSIGGGQNYGQFNAAGFFTPIAIEVSGTMYAHKALGSTAWVHRIANGTGAAGDLCSYIAGGQPAHVSDTTTYYIAFYDPGLVAAMGAIVRNGVDVVAYSTSSDGDQKTEINARSRRGLDTLKRIKVKDFYFTKDVSKTEQQGMFAQELQADYPDAVVSASHPPMDENGNVIEGEASTYWGIDYGRLTPLTIQAIQDLVDRVEALEQRVAELEGQGKTKN